jgi:hypothetical protein
LLVKLPDPDPSEVLLSDMVGLAVKDQQTPLAVIDPPPSEVIFPPEMAVVVVIEVANEVVRVATIIGFVLNEISSP